MLLFEIVDRISKRGPVSRNPLLRPVTFLLVLVGFFFITVSLVPPSAHSQAWSGILDPSRAVDWTQAGFQIVEPPLQCSNQNGSYSPSGGDDAASINSLIAGCKGGGYILLSAGNFEFSTAGLKFNAVNNVELRGAGPDKTKLVMTTSTPATCQGTTWACILGSTNSYTWYAGNATWTAGYAQGSTVLTLGSTSGLAVGQMVILDQDDDSYGLLTSGTGCSESGTTVICNTTIAHNFNIGDTVAVGGYINSGTNTCGQGTNAGYGGWWTVTAVNVPGQASPYNFQYVDPTTGLSPCTGGFASMDTGGIFVSNVTNETIFNNQTYIGRTCPNTGTGQNPNVACLTNEVSQRGQAEIHIVSAINGNQITITPPVMMNNWRASQHPGVYWTGNYPSQYATGDGIEALTIDSSTAPAPVSEATVELMNAYQCWIKNVRVVSNDPKLLMAAWSSNLDIVDSYFVALTSGTSNSYGLDNYQSSNILFQNNILVHKSSTLISEGGYGFVYGYNYSVDAAYNNPGWMIQDMSMNHGVTGMALFEGNDVAHCEADDDHGPGTDITLFRNRCRGQDTPQKSADLQAVTISAFGRGNSVIGSVLGTVGSETVYSEASNGTVYGSGYVYSLGLPGENGSNIANGYDPLTASTLLRWGNYDVATGAVRWCGNSSDPGWSTVCGGTSEIPTTGFPYINANPVPSGTTLPNSLYLSAQPPFWTMGSGYGSTPPWPAIGPDVTGGTAPDGVGGYSYAIPAQLCYENTPVDPAYQSTFAVTGGSWSSGTVTLTTPLNTLAADATITVSGVSPSGYNGTWQVTAASANTVSFALTTNPGSYLSGGAVAWPNILLFSAANCYPEEDGDLPAPPTNLTAVVN